MEVEVIPEATPIIVPYGPTGHIFDLPNDIIGEILKRLTIVVSCPDCEIDGGKPPSQNPDPKCKKHRWPYRVKPQKKVSDTYVQSFRLVCKLFNRVFLHYVKISFEMAQRIINGACARGNLTLLTTVIAVRPNWDLTVCRQYCQVKEIFSDDEIPADTRQVYVMSIEASVALARGHWNVFAYIITNICDVLELEWSAPEYANWPPPIIEINIHCAMDREIVRDHGMEVASTTSTDNVSVNTEAIVVNTEASAVNTESTDVKTVNTVNKAVPTKEAFLCGYNSELILRALDHSSKYSIHVKGLDVILSAISLRLLVVATARASNNMSLCGGSRDIFEIDVGMVIEQTRKIISHPRFHLMDDEMKSELISQYNDLPRTIDGMTRGMYGNENNFADIDLTQTFDGGGKW